MEESFLIRLGHTWPLDSQQLLTKDNTQGQKRIVSILNDTGVTKLRGKAVKAREIATRKKFQSPQSADLRRLFLYEYDIVGRISCCKQEEKQELSENI